MAIKVGGVTVINDSRGLENITDGLSAQIKKPSITTPTNGDTGFDALSGAILRVVAPYNSLYDLDKQSTQVQVSTNSDFSSPNIDYTSNTDTITYAISVFNPGSGNKFYVNGSFVSSLTLYEGRTYRFDQSNGTNSGHPLRLSITSNGTHGSGSEYTTGVTTAGTPGSTGAYTEITVASGTATLYTYCSNHGGMGWEVLTSNSDITFDFDTLESGLFSTNTQYYIRVKHIDFESNTSGYSDSISITTPTNFTFVQTPAITSPTAGSADNFGYPEITASAFVATGTTDTHASSDWQIATDSSFSNIVDSSIGDTTNLISYTVSTELATSTTHYVRVRYNGTSLGASEYSSTISFTTLSQYATFWAALSDDVESWGGAYVHGIGHIVDNANNGSALVSGNRSSSFEIHRYGNDGEDEGRIEYGSPLNVSSMYAAGFAQLSSTLAAAGGHWNNGDDAYIHFLDISNGGLSNTATYKIESSHLGTMRGLDPGHISPASSTSVYGLGGIASSYNGYNLYELTSSGAIPYWNRVSLASGQMFPRGMATLSTGHVVVVATYRDTGSQEWLGFVVHNPTTLTVNAAYFIVNQADSSWTGGNNSHVSELSNGNILVGDWQFIAEVNLNMSGGNVGTPTIVRHLSIERSDKSWETSNGNIVVTSSQTTPFAAEYQPSGTGYSLVAARALLFPVSGSGSSDEIYGSAYSSVEDALWMAGKYYTGSQYNAMLLKVPATLSDLDDTGATWPNNTQFAWEDYSPTVRTRTPNLTNWQTTSGGGWALSNNTTQYQPSVTTISQTTAESNAQTRIGGAGNIYYYE